MGISADCLTGRIHFFGICLWKDYFRIAPLGKKWRVKTWKLNGKTLMEQFLQNVTR